MVFIMKLTYLKTTTRVLTVALIALSASYGVFKFSLLFTPFWVSVITAVAFELVYITMAISNDRRRFVVYFAVLSSVIYNTLAGSLSHIDHISDLDIVSRSIFSLIHAATLAPLAAWFVHSHPNSSDNSADSSATVPSLPKRKRGRPKKFDIKTV